MIHRSFKVILLRILTFGAFFAILGLSQRRTFSGSSPRDWFTPKRGILKKRPIKKAPPGAFSRSRSGFHPFSNPSVVDQYSEPNWFNAFCIGPFISGMCRRHKQVQPAFFPGFGQCEENRIKLCSSLLINDFNYVEISMRVMKAFALPECANDLRQIER